MELTYDEARDACVAAGYQLAFPEDCYIYDILRNEDTLSVDPPLCVYLIKPICHGTVAHTRQIGPEIPPKLTRIYAIISAYIRVIIAYTRYYRVYTRYYRIYTRYYRVYTR